MVGHHYMSPFANEKIAIYAYPEAFKFIYFDHERQGVNNDTITNDRLCFAVKNT